MLLISTTLQVTIEPGMFGLPTDETLDFISNAVQNDLNAMLENVVQTLRMKYTDLTFSIG